MAKFASDAYSIIRGSVGTTVFTSNQHARLIARARTFPDETASAGRTIVWDNMTAGSASWASRTQARRDRWQAAASRLTRQNPVNDYVGTGRNLYLAVYCARNYSRSRSALSRLDCVDPLPTGMFCFDSVHIVDPTAGNTGFRVKIVVSDITTGRADVLRSDAFNTTRNRYYGPYLYAQWRQVPFTAVGTYYAAYNGLTAGKVYFIRLRGCASVPGWGYTHLYFLRAIAITV